jgi:hypothetical protein
MPLSSRVRKLNFEAFHKMSKDISLFEQFANDSGVDGLKYAEMPLTLNTRPLPLLVLFLLSSSLLPLFLAIFIRSNQSPYIATYTLRPISTTLLRPISTTLQSLHSPTSHQTLFALRRECFKPNRQLCDLVMGDSLLSITDELQRYQRFGSLDITMVLHILERFLHSTSSFSLRGGNKRSKEVNEVLKKLKEAQR